MKKKRGSLSLSPREKWIS
jgi:hypothetical protein